MEREVRDVSQGDFLSEGEVRDVRLRNLLVKGEVGHARIVVEGELEMSF